MRSASGGPRVLLRRLRETMAEQVSAQERLDKIVVLIAANMVAEVCSTYVLRVDNTLELYATEGLNRDAVHRTVLTAHEGLVGLVASEATPLNLSDAQNHPAFSFRPETGEEIYHSFLGVPILRAGNTLGVLVVQNLPHGIRCTRPARSCPTASRSAMWCCTSRVSSSPITSPRTCRRKSSGSTPRWRNCAPTSTACWSAATSPKAASTATCWKPIGCSPTIMAGRTSCTKRSPPASPPKPRSNACNPIPVPACCVPPIPICAIACMTSKTSAIG